MTRHEFRHHLLEHGYLILCVALCLASGRLVFAFVGGLPASIYGMILFALGLRSGLLSESKISACIDFYLKNLTIVFIPVALGIMQYGDLLQRSGWKIVLVAVVTTLVGMVTVGRLSQRVLDGAR